jgi:hypothetical protein
MVLRVPSVPTSIVEAKRGWAARRADDLVDVIARHKAGMLASSIAVTATLGVAAGIAVGAGEGDPLTSGVTATGGYIAILALVLGFPALCYAMVTDRSVDALSAAKRESLRDSVGQILSDGAKELLPADHYVQLFRPNHRRTLLTPVYDPTQTGPKEGWGIKPSSPQAVTGSAWVTNSYYFAMGAALSDESLRLTPAQKESYENLTGVAAAPVRDADGNPIAVLTIFTSSDSPNMDSNDYISRHVVLADRVAHGLRQITGPLDFGKIAAPSEAAGHDRGSMPLTDEVLTEARKRTATHRRPL